MAIFGFGKDKKEQGSSELVLAYLEDVQRLRTPVQLRDPKNREVASILQSIDEEGGRLTFQLSGPLMAEKGERIRFVYLHDTLRLGGQSKLLEVRSGTAVLDIPSELELRERRRKPRARINPREGSTLTALTSLFEGVGVSGILENISEEGARMKIERALEVKGERKLNIATGLFPIGHAFMLVKLGKLPKLSTTVELSGKVAYMDSTGGGLSVGITFTEVASEASGAIRRVVSDRVSSLPTSIPPKSRRPKDNGTKKDNETTQDTSRPTSAPPPPTGPPALGSPTPPSPTPTPVTSAAPGAPEISAVDEPKAAPDRNPALLRLKKRTRTVVVAMAPGGHRDVLLSHFLEEGYGRVFTADTLTELLGLLNEQKVALIFIDGGVAELQGFDLAEALQQVGETHIPLVLAAEEVSTATVLAARRVGVDQLIVKPYVLDETFSSIFEQQMGLG